MNYKIKLHNISSQTDIIKISDDAVSYILAEFISNSSDKLFFHIVENDARILELRQQIKFLFPELNILTFSAWDSIPFDKSSPKPNIVAGRIETLFYLKSKIKNKTLVIATINSAIQKNIPINNIAKSGFILKNGDEINLDDLIGILIKNGYQRSPTADNVGEFAVRGGIIDIIIQNQENKEIAGYRLDFFGNVIESIRIFDPITQISSEEIKQISLLPSKEIILNQESISNFKRNYRNLFGIPKNDLFYEEVVSGRNVSGIEHFMPLFFNQDLNNIFDYLDINKAIITLENKIENKARDRFDEIEQYYQARIKTLKESRMEGNIYNPIPPSRLYLGQKELNQYFKDRTLIRFDNFENNYFSRPIDLGLKLVPDFFLASKSNKCSAFKLIDEFIAQNATKSRVLISCNSIGSANRLEKILLNNDITSKVICSIKELYKLKRNIIALSVINIKIGFYNDEILIISEDSIFGKKNNIRKPRKIAAGLIRESLGIAKGELVVHRYYGIGRFEGLENVKAGNRINDFLKLSYFAGDALFIPVEDIDLITRYGADNPLIKLDKLGSSSNWQSRSKSIRRRVKVAAEALIKIAAQRKLKKANILIPKTIEYNKFKDNFLFIDTEDQLKSTSDIEEDLKAGKPMDRLICGDVGFGKTEIAMRAAFMAVKNEGKRYQVAIITPTTLLCRQHYHSFIERFKDFDISIAQLSRMITLSKSKIVKENIENGKIDIIIGTHALLNDRIKFKSLALIIIDEEQHFGVSQKEKLKQLKNEVHVLNLSATPIPRTLQMSLTGIKDLSLIATPPIDRIAIRSFVMDYDPVIIKEAIMREFYRGGKIFFVVPRIRDLEEIYPKIAKLVPDVIVRTAHGKMSAKELDEIMNDFYDGKFHLLIATTIIESGIDIKDANTIIIYKSHMFGLSQLYQLRGRVGRGKIRAYAYITTPPHRKLTEVSKKKLQVMQTIDSLGAGFNIASHDMDIRGGGNILGDEQSGHIKETGIELYQDMLKEEISKINKNNQEELYEYVNKYHTQIKLKISLVIPDDYISDLGLRLSFYKRMSQISSLEEKEQLAIEIIDRFGKLPEQINNLLEISYIKYLCQKSNIEKIELKQDGIWMSFKDNYFEHSDKLLAMIFENKNTIKLHNNKLLFMLFPKNDSEKLTFSLNIVNKILKIKNE